MSKTNIDEKLLEFYDYEVPEYVLSAGKSYIRMGVSDVITEEPKKLKITIENIVEYFKTQAPSMSGLRCLAGYCGDWRPIDNLAQEVLGWFKFANVDNLRKVSIKNGLEPRF